MSERLSPLALQTRLASVTVVDVRQPMEVAGGRIPCSRCIPLDRIDRAELPEGDLVLVCQSGNRSGQAAALVKQRWPGRTVLDLEGGLEGWQQAGLPVERQAGAPLPLMRQVQIAAGSLVLLGLIGSQVLAPAWMALSWFVGAGLMFAGISGFCGMARLLAMMPWNRVRL
ncbi:rhodanese-like domain-containing protein [Synechococcus sp. W2B2]|uniref:rhodanese-like domain-containing protein n=1 Tax=unclassified Synechococcus TaxID=2626047 RepID=UPI00006ADB75|nr:rhodanese-like domain-containing protein [Synechococcus sp. WH 7805]EAR17674.1 Rhodanese-like protein [Synechococcus sp. WH 7805]